MLHLAVMKRNQRFVKRLLLSGADINCVDMVRDDVIPEFIVGPKQPFIIWNR